jgi:hypothetical protein
VIEYLVSPDGDIVGYGENGIGQPGTTGAVSTLGASAYSVNPAPGNELFQPYSGDIVFSASSASASALPDSAATTLKAGAAVTRAGDHHQQWRQPAGAVPRPAA